MPGGRGELPEIANGLNNSDHKQVADGYIMWIDAGYDVLASTSSLSAAIQACRHKKSLMRVWCHALERGRVVGDY